MARSKTKFEPKKPALAKLTRPAVAGVYVRTRLFRLLDQACRKPVVWISGPGGAGKTTLAASYLQTRRLPVLWYQMDAGDDDIGSFFYYMGLAAKTVASKQRVALPLLTAEYIAGLPAFTANYFRKLFGYMKRPGVLVLDNFQEARNSALQEVLQQGFEQIPPQITVLVISREEPTGAFARSRASGRLAFVGWEDLKLTEEETAAIVKLRGKHAASRMTPNDLYQETQGWVAALVLLTERSEAETTEQPRPRVTSSQAIFDYFANEIFQRGDASVRDFLLKTAFLPKVSITVAQALVGENDSETILQYLTRRNFFTVKHTDGSYEYHPLFRAFLLNRVKTIYGTEQIKELKQRSAELLAESGNIEAAVTLLQQAEHWDTALPLVLKHARALSLQGRTQTLETWLRNFPSRSHEENPWIHYWMGVCRLPFAPSEAREHFERAFALFERGDDATPLYLAWSRIIESALFEMDEFTPMVKWLDRYPTLKGDRAPPPKKIENTSIFTYISGLTNTRPDHPDFAIYVKSAEMLLRDETERDRQLVRVLGIIPCFLWQGDLTKMGNLLEQIAFQIHSSDTLPLLRLHWYSFKAMHAATTGDAEESLRAATDGLALADSTGAHFLDFQFLGYGISGQIVAGNVAAARALLQRWSLLPRGGKIKEALYRHNSSVVALHEGDVIRAVDDGRRAAELAKDSQMFIGTVAYRTALAYAYVQQGNLDTAADILKEARPMADAMHSKIFGAACALCEANIHYLRGEESLMLRALNDALSFMQEGDFMTAGYCPRDTAATLYNIALDANIHTDHVRTVISKTRLSPPRNSPSEHWPWPIRIYTLGRFSVMKDDEVLTFSGRTHQKPLALLRAIVRHGKRDVNTALLAQTLWPDADGDMADHALRTNLYRLRKLLGEQSIETHGGHLRLNPEYCWIDVWSLEQLLADTDLSVAVRAQRLIAIYRGPLLEDDETTLVLKERERLHSAFINAITKLGQTFESEAHYEQAIACYRKGIDVDPTNEKLYRHLMQCYRNADRLAEALATYQRCRKMLASVLDIEPSVETQTLYEEIKR